MENQKFNFEFNVEEANVLLTGLAELPAKVSMSLIMKIQQAAQEQSRATGSEVKEPEIQGIDKAD